MLRSFLHIFLLLVCVSATVTLHAQSKDKGKIIQFSGMVFYEDDEGAPAPLPYTNVFVKGTQRGASATGDGFFSFVALTGETIVFSRIGFKTVEFTIPDTLKAEEYKWIQIMAEDEYILDAAIIMPWPSKEHFKQEFLAIDISDDLRENALENLANDKLKDPDYYLPADGRETSKIVMRQQELEYRYSGQIKPQNIFSPLAWKKFVDAWRRGDFKKKKN